MITLKTYPKKTLHNQPAICGKSFSHLFAYKPVSSPSISTSDDSGLGYCNKHLCGLTPFPFI